jgi:hypothetical protein
VDPTGSEFSFIVRYAKLDSVVACALVCDEIEYSSGVRETAEISTLVSSTIQIAVPPVLAGTLIVPTNCNFLPAFIVPEAARLDADKVTTGDNNGKMLIVTLVCADLVEL